MAAGRNIKGITIEIGGDTTGLDKALNGTQRELKTTQSALKDTDRLLKLNPGSVELLTQKQGYLTTAIDDTKKKLDVEKEALRQMKENNTTGEVTEQQKALEREIEATEQQLKSLEDQYKTFGSVAGQQIQAAGKSIQDAGKKITEVGKGLTTHVTAPVVAVGGLSVAAFKEVDSALDIVTKKTGATGEALDDMKGIVKDIATEIPTDFETAASAVSEVNTRFGLTGDALEDLSGKFVKFAELNKTDVTTAVDKTQKAMEAFGVPTEEAGDFLDALNKAAQDSGIGVDRLTDSMVKNAPALQQMGYSASDSAKFLGDLEKSGVESSDVLGGLKKAMVNATKEGKPMSTALAEVQESIKGAGTDTEATRIAMDLFGNKAGASIAKAVRDGKLSFEDLGTSLADYAGNVDTTFENTLSPLERVQAAMNGLKEIGAEIVESAAPMLETAVNGLRDGVEWLADKWDALNSDQQETVIKLALVAAAAGPVITVLGGLVDGVGAVATSFGSMISAIGASGGLIPALGGLVTAAGPFLVGGAVIAGLVAGAVLIVKNWDKIKETAGKVRDGVKRAWDTLKTNTQTAFENMKTTVTEKAETLKTNTLEKWNTLRDNATTAWNTLRDNVGSAIETARDNVAGKAQTIYSSVTGTFGDLAGEVKTKWDGISSTITDKIKAARDGVEKAVDKIKGFLDFKWSLPKIKLPHFGIKGNFSLNPPSVPTFEISWYKSAYNDPVLFTRPTVLQTPSGLKGFGDGAGAEIVMGLNKLRQIAGAGNTTYNVNVYGSAGQSVNALADAVQNRLVALQRQREAAGLA